MMKHIALFICLLFAQNIYAQQDTLSITLENVKYAYPVKYLPLNAEGQDVKMAYMDVAPASQPNGQTVVLFHGKNFGGYYWTNVIQSLTKAGFRVIVPDQVGFGKSSKPFIHYSFHQLATWNKQLLDTLGIKKIKLMGHSMGGMLATRFSLMFPETVEKLLLENPIGYEDYRTFVPYVNTEKQYQNELKTTASSVKKYYESSYFTQWKPQYDELVRIAGGVTFSADYPRWAKVAALTFTMIYEQPVCYEFKNLKMPVVIFNGLQDKTIVGKGLLSDDEKAQHGRYNILAKQVAKQIPNCKLIEFDGCGHIPHWETPETFLKSLISNI